MNETITPVCMRGFRCPTDVEMAVDETLKVCGISGDDATVLYIEVMHRLARLGIVTDQVKYECGCERDRTERRTNEPNRQQ